MPPGGEGAAGFSREDDRKVARAVGVAVTHAGPEEDHRIVQDVGVPFLQGAEAFKEVGVLGDMPGVDPLVFLQLGRVVLVVGDLVVAALDAVEEGEVPSRNVRKRKP